MLADELGIATDTTAKWIYDRNTARAGQLLVIDEARLAGTLTLERIATQAAQAGAKVLLVGDWAQLAAVDAGGAFALLASARDDTPELTQVHRFRQPWEADASLRLRGGDPAVIDTYAKHDRLRAGDHEEMLDAAYHAWRTDLDAGRASVMIAPTRDTVTALNTRARADRILAGDVAANGAVALHDGTHASAGDVVVTRRNDRRLLAGKHWVRNGDRWTVTATHPDGGVTVRGPHGRVQLPAAYVAEHLELGYASTVHRAQGRTVDTAHAIVQPGMTREALYVAMTRGRDPTPPTSPPTATPAPERS